MKNHTIICGYGRVGRKLATQLKHRGSPLVIVDATPERILAAEDAGHLVVQGDASCDEILEEAGIRRAKCVASVLPHDAINVFITLTARDLNPDLEIIARAESQATERKLRRSGADHVVMPAAIGAVRIAQIVGETLSEQEEKRMSHAGTTTYLKTVAVSNCDQLADSTLALAQEMLSDMGAIVGIQRADRDILTELDSQLVLGPEDILLLSRQVPC